MGFDVGKVVGVFCYGCLDVFKSGLLRIPCLFLQFHHPMCCPMLRLFKCFLALAEGVVYQNSVCCVDVSWPYGSF